MTAKPESERKWTDAVLLAVLNTPHAITAQKIVLEFDRSKPGHNATNQLHLRIEAAVASHLTKQDALMAQLVEALDGLVAWADDLRRDDPVEDLRKARAALKSYEESK